MRWRNNNIPRFFLLCCALLGILSSAPLLKAAATEQSKQLLEKLELFRRQLDQAENRLREIQGKKIKAESRLATLQSRVIQLKGQIQLGQKHLEDEFYSLYLLRRVRAATLFPGLHHDPNFLRSQRLLQKAAALDFAAVRSWNKKKALLWRKTKNLQQLKTTWAQLEQQEFIKKTTLSQVLQQQTRFLNQLRSPGPTKIAYQKERAKAGEELARLRPEKLLLPLTAQGEYHEARPELRGLKGLKAKLPLPVQGLLQQNYNPSRARDLYGKGVLVQTQADAEVKATLGGRVVFAGPFVGLGQLVLLDHGKGALSLYGNLKSLAVKKGSEVSQGTPLGQVRQDPENNLPLFYFELRYRSRPVDPLIWLVPPRWKEP